MMRLRRYTVLTFYDTDDARIEKEVGRCWTWRGAMKLAESFHPRYLVSIWDERRQRYYYEGEEREAC